MNTAITTQNSPLTLRIKELMKGHTDRHEEKEIIGLLRTADSVDLNRSLLELPLDVLFDDVDDRFVGPDNKTELLNMLSKERLKDIETGARAAILEGLAKGWTGLAEGIGPSAGGIEEQSISHVFLGSSGQQLTDLKNVVNQGADHYDMHNLLYSDLDHGGLRANILEHFSEQSGAIETRSIKPLSDIDDTFYSSLKDKRYPSKSVYPGVLAFYDELDRGAREAAPDRPGDLTYITARPGEFTGIVKDKAHESLREKGVKEAAVLVGSLTGLISHEKMAAKKFENFEQYAGIYPEYDFTWLGDSGQGDAILGAKLQTHHPERMKGIFIHDIMQSPQEEKDSWSAKGVHFFDTYIGAANKAHQLGLISDEGLQRVIQATRADLEAIDNWDSPEQKQARFDDVERDLAGIESA